MQKFKLFILSPFIFILLFSSCGGSSVKEEIQTAEEPGTELISVVKNQEDEKKDIPNFNNTSAATEKYVNKLINHYVAVKDALVQSDYSDTQKKAESLINEIKAFNTKKELKGEQEAFYLKIGAKLKNNAERLQKSVDLKDQRVHFSALTSNMLDIVKAFGGNENKVYYQFCPMAFDNTGGFWLSLNKEIENPYFGDKMLKCGMIRETIE